MTSLCWECGKEIDEGIMCEKCAEETGKILIGVYFGGDTTEDREKVNDRWEWYYHDAARYWYVAKPFEFLRFLKKETSEVEVINFEKVSSKPLPDGLKELKDKYLRDPWEELKEEVENIVTKEGKK